MNYLNNKIKLWKRSRYELLKVSQAGEDELTYPQFYLSVRDTVLRELLSDAEGDVVSMERVMKTVGKRIAFYNIKRRVGFRQIAGADASSYCFPLASRFLAVISAVVYRLPDSRRFFLPPVTLEVPHGMSDDKFAEILSLRREAFLYHTAAEFVKRHANEVKLLLMDGPLVFSSWHNNIGRERDRHLLASNVNTFLALCKENDITVAGIVKRSTARYYVKWLGLEEETDLTDSSILVHLLKKGQRTEVFSPASSFMNRVDFLIDSFFARLSNHGLITPVRVDVPSFSREWVDDIASCIYLTAYSMGIPLVITRADEEARLTRKFMKEIYAEALSKVRRLFGDVSWLSVRDRRWLKE